MAGDVLQEHQLDLALAAQLDEVGRLERRLAVQDAVVEQNSMPTAFDLAKPQIAAWCRSAP
jgi:hypothetical protein